MNKYLYFAYNVYYPGGTGDLWLVSNEILTIKQLEEKVVEDAKRLHPDKPFEWEYAGNCIKRCDVVGYLVLDTETNYYSEELVRLYY